MPSFLLTRRSMISSAKVAVFDEDRLQGVAEDGLDGDGVFVIYLEAAGENAIDSGAEKSGVIEPFKNFLGALEKAFAVLENLLEDIEAGLLCR